MTTTILGGWDKGADYARGFLFLPWAFKTSGEIIKGHLFMHQRLHLPLTLGEMDG